MTLKEGGNNINEKDPAQIFISVPGTGLVFEPDGLSWNVYGKDGDADFLKIATIAPRDVQPESSYATNPTHDMTVGDFDGDGEYEIVVKWRSTQQDPMYSEPIFGGGNTTTAPEDIDVYKQDGTHIRSLTREASTGITGR